MLINLWSNCCDDVLVCEHAFPSVPAHLVEEAVRLSHTVQFMFVLFQQIHVTLLWDKLQHLTEKQVQAELQSPIHFTVKIRHPACKYVTKCVKKLSAFTA